MALARLVASTVSLSKYHFFTSNDLLIKNFYSHSIFCPHLFHKFHSQSYRCTHLIVLESKEQKATIARVSERLDESFVTINSEACDKRENMRRTTTAPHEHYIQITEK